MELLQSQVQRLNQQQLQSVELLQMSTLELEAHLRDLAQENPLIELEEAHPEPSAPKDDELLRRLRWLEDNDRQNHYYQRVDDEEFDPLTRAGCSGGLFDNIDEAAQILAGGSVGCGEFGLSVYPTSIPVSLELTKIGATASLLQTGAVIKPSFCGPCFGAGDVPANNGLSIRHTTHNFPNR